jgi:hydrogenase expression/formation protein HypD
LESIKIARNNPDKEVVFFAVGFETTAPGNAMAIHQAKREGISNFFELVSHVLVPPAMEALLSSPKNRVQAYLAAGHVCAIMGWWEYDPIAEKYKVPIIPTGFEPIDVLEGILLAVKQLEKGEHRVENQYLRAVKREGNKPAQDIVNKVFEVSHRKWRGIGEIPQSGLTIRKEFSEFDAELKFAVGDIVTQESELCISGIVLQGLKKPFECPAFGKECTPTNPLGATMVSSEGACAAYYKYQRIKND